MPVITAAALGRVHLHILFISIYFKFFLSDLYIFFAEGGPVDLGPG